MADRIYLDHASTTPILPEAAAAIRTACEAWANPSSAHAEGRAVRAAMEEARRRLAAALGWDGTLIFTSGATEAIDIVLRRARAGARIVSAIEHPAVLRSAGGEARQIAVRSDGTLDLAALDAALAGSERPRVAVQAVNNETGVIHPLDAIAAAVRAAICRASPPRGPPGLRRGPRRGSPRPRRRCGSPPRLRAGSASSRRDRDRFGRPLPSGSFQIAERRRFPI